jgi:hypothetical protein
MRKVAAMKHLSLLLCPLLAAPLACSSQETATGAVNRPGEMVEYPVWVQSGSGLKQGDGHKVFFGVGSATGIQNAGLARQTADNRARAEISKLFETYSASLMKDFQESVTAGDFSASSESQLVQQAIKTFSANTINGAQVSEHWIHPTDGTIFSLCELDMQAFMDSLSGHKELNEKTKEAVKRAAEKAFADLDAEEAKHADE